MTVPYLRIDTPDPQHRVKVGRFRLAGQTALPAADVTPEELAALQAHPDLTVTEVEYPDPA